MSDTLTAIVWFYLKCQLALYYLVSTALYLDQEKMLIRQHCKSPRMVALKMALAPLTLVYIAWRITIAWPKFLWTHRIAGCFVGNRPPVWRQEAIATYREIELARAAAWESHPHYRGGPASSVSSACCRNAIVNTQGPSSVVNDLALLGAMR